MDEQVPSIRQAVRRILTEIRGPHVPLTKDEQAAVESARQFVATERHAKTAARKRNATRTSKRKNRSR